MRQLKFRYYDDLLKRLVYSDEFEWTNALDKLEKFFQLASRYASNGVVQQYTGLKDKNGIEIYEGDILKLNELNYEVMGVDGQFIATCPYYNKHHWPKFEHFAREARCSEVVGNIFENPELLKA
jgi:uncharacterized phage protein (TIGR01671 family)